MEIQSNPYLIWLLIPAVILFGTGMYIRTRPRRRRVSGVFSILMFAGAFWAFAGAIQLISPDPGWQRLWIHITYIGIMAIPTAWFLIAVRLTGAGWHRIRPIERWLWVVPAVTYLSLLTNPLHSAFFISFNTSSAGGFVSLVPTFGPLFYAHTAYSYLLLLAGILTFAYSVASDFRRWGIHASGLIIGVLAPLIGNAYFLFGSPPPGFPDPTPIAFTVTGIGFAWAIFGGRLLAVVPLAHDRIVRRLSTGVVILDSDRTVRDINPAAIDLLGLQDRQHLNTPITELFADRPAITAALLPALAAPNPGSEIEIAYGDRSIEVQITRITNERGSTSGWLVQFKDISEQKRAEAGMVVARESLETVLNTLPDGFFEADLNGTITFVNEEFSRRVGAPREEVIGRHFRHFTNRESIREIFQTFQQVIETKKAIGPFRYDYRSLDGRLNYAETIVSPILSGGTVVGTRGMLRDINNRIKAEQEIAEQKDMLDSLLDQSPLAMVINDLDEKITVVNPAFERLFGYTEEEVLGRDLDDILSTPELREEMKELTARGKQERVSLVGKRKRKDGTLVDVEMFAAPFFVRGERFGYLAFYHDISEQLKAEADLANTRVTINAILDSLADPYFEATSDGVIQFANQAFANAVGYETKEEVLGINFRRITAREKVREVFEKFRLFYETKAPIEPFEFHYRQRDGNVQIAEIVVSPILEDGEVVGSRGIVRDISARIEAERILKEARDAAEYRAGELAAINRVASQVSRSLDLNEILGSVCRELTKIFPVRNAGIGLLTPDRQHLEVVAFHAANPEESSALGIRLPLEGNPASQEVISQMHTVVVQDAQSDPRTQSVADLSKARGTRSIMIVPLLTRGEAIGTIGMPALDGDHIFSESEIELAETIASQIAAAIENAQLHEMTEKALDVAERDLEIGRQIQSGFFPDSLPDLPGWELAAHFHAARQVAGDFYDVFRFQGSNLTAFIVADVCDKGVGAALFMVLLRSLLRAFSNTRVIADNAADRLHEIVLNTNNFIAETHGQSNMFATLFFGVLDPDTGLLHYINGGHEPPVVMDRGGALVARLMPTGPAVGLFPDLEFQVEQMQIEPGHLLVGFTDGATDARSETGEMYSEERLLETIASPWTSIFSMLFELRTDLQKHIGSRDQFDDITLVSFRRSLPADHGEHAVCRVARIDALGELRDFAEQAAAHSGADSEAVFAFKLAAEEICMNIISYGYAGREPGLLSIFFDVEDGTARMTIRDDGTFFSPEQAAQPDLEADWTDRQLGGLGIYLVQEMMDNVTYTHRDEGFNELVLEKKIF